jgi:hypothetical protein
VFLRGVFVVRLWWKMVKGWLVDGHYFVVEDFPLFPTLFLATDVRAGRISLQRRKRGDASTCRKLMDE